MGYIIRQLFNSDDAIVGTWETVDIVDADNNLMVFDTKELAEAYLQANGLEDRLEQWQNKNANMKQWVWQHSIEILDESDKDNYVVWIKKPDGTMAIHVWESNTWVERV